jgi:hypothetical protein
VSVQREDVLEQIRAAWRWEQLVDGPSFEDSIYDRAIVPLLAEAWDEGAEEGYEYGVSGAHPLPGSNPYRQTEEPEE